MRPNPRMHPTVERRNAEIENGAVSLVSGPAALDRLKAEFR